MTPQPTQKDVQKPQAISLKSGLYLIATPIGNMRDITFRALDVLSAVDLVLCEDTRVTGKLLSAFGFKKKMMTYNDHSTEPGRKKILALLEEGQAVALMSDAGTPLISDPGYKLVRSAMQQGVAVTSLPGANAALTGLQLSGLPSDKFVFLGFLPSKTNARQKALEEWKDAPGTLVAYETAPRLLASLQDIETVLGEREVAVTRELTKMYEEVKRGPVSELIDWYSKKGAPKGEIVVVISYKDAVRDMSGESIEDQLRKALKTMSVRDAAEVVATATGKPKKTIYTLALKLAS